MKPVLSFIWKSALGIILFAVWTIWLASAGIHISDWMKVSIFALAPFLLFVALDACERSRTGKITETYDNLRIISGLISTLWKPKNLFGSLWLVGICGLVVPILWHRIEANANTINALGTSIYCILTSYLVIIGFMNVQVTVESSRRDAANPPERKVTWGTVLRDVGRLLIRRRRP